jgi:hypothetical protein
MSPFGARLSLENDPILIWQLLVRPASEFIRKSAGWLYPSASQAIQKFSQTVEQAQDPQSRLLSLFPSITAAVLKESVLMTDGLTYN